MTSMHTPGPWSPRPGEHPGFFYIESASGDVVYLTGSLQPGHTEANAHLIAAAPQLLEALQDARREIAALVAACGVGVCTEAALAAADVAIGKATGEA